MPPSACSNQPAREVAAPVKAPRSWPNSSDSKRRLGDRCAVDLDERLASRRALSQLWTCAGEEFLAGSRTRPAAARWRTCCATRSQLRRRRSCNGGASADDPEALPTPTRVDAIARASAVAGLERRACVLVDQRVDSCRICPASVARMLQHREVVGERPDAGERMRWQADAPPRTRRSTSNSGTAMKATDLGRQLGGARRIRARKARLRVDVLDDDGAGRWPAPAPVMPSPAA